DPMQSRPHFRSTTLCAAPIDETHQRHKKKRLGIAGNKKEGSGMGDDRQRAEKLERRRKIPPLAKEKEITPETPRCYLSGNEQRVGGVEVQPVAKQSSDCRISGKKSNIGHFHHLLPHGRHDCLVAAVNDVSEPVTVVLNKSGVSIRKRPFRREQANRDRDLRQSQE